MICHSLISSFSSGLASSKFLSSRAPEAGYYMFTLVVREPHDDSTAGSIFRTLTTDPEDGVMLCRAEVGLFEHQTGTCTVRKHH